MADIKISDLTPLVGGAAADDEMIINESASGSFQTKKISIGQLAAAVGGGSSAQYLAFFQGDRNNATDNGIGYNNDGWWENKSPSLAPIQIGSETLKYTAPAGTVGAIILFCSRMSHKLSDNIQNFPGFNEGGEFNMKCFANCRQITPDAYWNTRAQPDTTVNGFAQRLITRATPTSTNADFDFQTYHSAKWDYVTWKDGPSTTDREFNYTVTWDIDELGWSRIQVGMNRVIILPVTADPQPLLANSYSYVDPFETLDSGVIPSEYYIPQSRVAEFDQKANAIRSTVAIERSERSMRLKAVMDKIHRNATSYITYTNNSSDAGTIALEAILAELYALKTSNDNIDNIEKAVFGDKSQSSGSDAYKGLNFRTAEIVGIQWSFDTYRSM